MDRGSLCSRKPSATTCPTWLSVWKRGLIFSSRGLCSRVLPGHVGRASFGPLEYLLRFLFLVRVSVSQSERLVRIGIRGQHKRVQGERLIMRRHVEHASSANLGAIFSPHSHLLLFFVFFLSSSQLSLYPTGDAFAETGSNSFIQRPRFGTHWLALEPILACTLQPPGG